MVQERDSLLVRTNFVIEPLSNLPLDAVSPTLCLALQEEIREMLPAGSVISFLTLGTATASNDGAVSSAHIEAISATEEEAAAAPFSVLAISATTSIEAFFPSMIPVEAEPLV